MEEVGYTVPLAFTSCRHFLYALSTILTHAKIAERSRFLHPPKKAQVLYYIRVFKPAHLPPCIRTILIKVKIGASSGMDRN